MILSELTPVVESLLNAQGSAFTFKIYDHLKMDDESYTVDSINGLAEIANGAFEPIKNLGQSALSFIVRFEYPVERRNDVLSVLQNASKASAGAIILNNTINASYTGVSNFTIDYPIQGTYTTDTLGEGITSTLMCTFVSNEKIVMGNEVELYIQNGYVIDETVTIETEGTYYTKSGTIYTEVTLPADYVAETDYYSKNWEQILFYNLKYNRTRNGEPTPFDNSIENLTLNSTQMSSFSLSVPSIRDSVINGIKSEMMYGTEMNKSYSLRFVDETLDITFDDMVATGSFTQDIKSGSEVVYQISFVKKQV